MFLNSLPEKGENRDHADRCRGKKLLSKRFHVGQNFKSFGPGSFRPGSFRPGSIRPWVVSAQFGGSFRPFFLNYQACYRRSTKYIFGLLESAWVVVRH